MNNNTGILNAVPNQICIFLGNDRKVKVVLKLMIIEFWGDFSFWYGKSNVSNKLRGVEVGVWDGHNYGPSIIMCPP